MGAFGVILNVCAGLVAGCMCRPKKVFVPFAAVLVFCFAPTANAGDPPSVLWTVQTADQFPPTIAAAPDGGVYVTSTIGGGTDQATLAHYSGTGSQVWRVSIGSSMRGQNVQADAAGNVYVAGETYTNLDGANQGAGDVFLRKYSSGGALLWGRQFGTPQYDSPQGLAVTPGGTAYITSGGWATNYGTPPPGSLTTLRQFLPDGSPGWVASLDTGDGSYPGGGAAGSQGTAIDGQGNILSFFANYTKVNNRITTLKYLAKVDAAGHAQWIESIPNATNQFGAAIDSSSNVYLSSWGLSKCDSAGNLLWSIPSNNFTLLADCVGPDGTVYVAGYGSTLAGYIAAYDPSGRQLWSTTVLPAGGADNLRLEGITLSGNQLVASGLLSTGGNWSGNQITALSVPEPGAITLLAAVLAPLALSRGRRAQR